jgi:hypothetical protein
MELDSNELPTIQWINEASREDLEKEIYKQHDLFRKLSEQYTKIRIELHEAQKKREANIDDISKIEELSRKPKKLRKLKSCYFNHTDHEHYT